MDKELSKVEEGKLEKKRKLLEAGYTLLGKKDIKDTSIQDIVDEAKIAKGTFYLYFKDKYDLQNHIIINKSHQLFNDAIIHLKKENITDFEKQMNYVINYIIDELATKPLLLKLIGKNMSLGIYSKNLSNLMESESLGLYNHFIDGLKKSKIKLKNPEVTFFIIVELVSSTCFTSIVKKEPLPINKYKPYLFDAIKSLLK